MSEKRRILMLTKEQIAYLLSNLVENAECAALDRQQENDLLNKLYQAKYGFEKENTI